MSSVEDNYKKWYRELIDDVAPWLKIAKMDRIQVQSGILLSPRKIDDLQEMMFRVVDIYANQKTCTHLNITHTGHTVPMGSFTAHEELCPRCGLVRFDD